MTRRFLPAVLIFAITHTFGADRAPVSAVQAADLPHPPVRRYDETLTGLVRNVDGRGSRLTVTDANNRAHVVDTRGAFVFLPGTRIGWTEDLKRGTHVSVTGGWTEPGRFEARAVHVVPGEATHPALGALFQIEGVVRDSDTVRARATVADAQGRRYTVDYLDAAVTGTNASRPGRRSWLARGMRVSVAGTPLPHSVVVADRVRIVSGTSDAPPTPGPFAAPSGPIVVWPSSVPVARSQKEIPAKAAPAVTVPPSPDPQKVLAQLDTYTGVLVDARHLADIARSPAPAVYGPGNTLLYPDRAHVPTPDQVQEASVVRYYRTEAEARKGVAGPNPLILPAQAVLGAARDGLLLGANDMTLFLALEKTLQFRQSWKVGFLVPGNQ